VLKKVKLPLMNQQKTKKEAVMHYLIKNTDFEEILKFLKQVKGIHKNNIEQLRKFIEGVCYVLRSGCQWRLLPFYYGNWRAAHKRFKQWEMHSIWKKLFEFVQKDPDMEWVTMDSTIVRAHACAAGYTKNSHPQEALGRSKGGFSTKIHALADALGNPLKFILTAGQRHDVTQAKALSECIENTTVIADTAYDADDFIKFLNVNHCKSEIPSRINRKHPRSYDEHLYGERHTIECFFGKVKYFRRIFSRFDKSARSYLSFLYFAGALIWLR
jgi:transposase